MLSLESWERKYTWWTRANTELAMRDWRRIAESFLHCENETAPPVLSLRYEDLIADEAAAIGRIAAHTGLDSAGFDREVFARKIHITGPDGTKPRSLDDWSALPSSLRALLDDEGIGMVAAAYGYDIQTSIRGSGRSAAASELACK
ncbi:hypothetical protein AB0C02_22895 [Micromonospora sp. NPDC048999]|uniref:hypothetical protein n=1 Tax=Micromonospora sp. NPDC048999 TaxID=3155391 RepID=UPI0033F56F6D